MQKEFKQIIERLAKQDVEALEKADESYGDSWKKRGGIGAYMVSIRKIDRIENQVEKFNYDIFKAGIKEIEGNIQDGILDDIRDYRRYLFLIEAEIIRLSKK